MWPAGKNKGMERFTGRKDGRKEWCAGRKVGGWHSRNGAFKVG